MLFDGSRLWMVDWEAAFQNDRYTDLAVVANMLVANETEEQTYLEEYFGAPPDSYQTSRFYLMRQLAHMFYTLAFLSLGLDGKPIDWSEPVPAYSDFQRRFSTGLFSRPSGTAPPSRPRRRPSARPTAPRKKSST